MNTPAPPKPPPAPAAGTAGAASAAAARKPAPPASKAPKKKKSGCLLPFLLIVLIAGAGAAVYYQPQQVERLLGIELPAFIPSAADKQEKPSPPPPTAKDTPTKADSEAPPAAPAANVSATELSELTRRVRQLQQAMDNSRQQQQAYDARLLRTEQQLARLAAQIADINQQQGNNEQQLQLIALQLQLDGDTQAAAAMLESLAAAMADTAAASTLLDEAARLKNIPSRSVLLSLLEALQTPATTTSATNETDNITDKLKTLFNIQHTPTAAAPSLARQQLAQLQLLLLTQREDAYWRLLVQIRTDGGGSVEVREILQRLYDYGAPDYRLRLTR